MRNRKLQALGAAAGLFGPFLAFPVQAADMAVVIGVSEYTDMPDLPSAATDAKAVASMLRAAGFVLPAANDPASGATLNPTKNDIDAILDDHGAFKNSGVVFFYFAGHGGQVGEQIYMLGSDARVPKATPGDKTSEDAESSGLRRRGVAISEVWTNFKPKKGTGIAVIVDACRLGSDASEGGPNPPDDCLLICSTEARTRAQNGEGGNPSPFTKVTIEQLRKGETLLKTMEVTADRLDRESGQRPALYAKNKTSRIAGHALFGPTARGNQVPQQQVPPPPATANGASHTLSGSFTFRGTRNYQYKSTRSVTLSTKGGVPQGAVTLTFADEYPQETFGGRVVFLGTWRGNTFSGDKQQVLENDYAKWPNEKFSIRFADDFSSATGSFEFWSANKRAWIKASGTFRK